MKFDTDTHELVYGWASEDNAFDGDVAAPTGAFAKVDLDVDDGDEFMLAVETFGSAHLIVTEDSDGHVYVRGYEKSERDQLFEKMAGAYALWDADIEDGDAQTAIAGYLEGALFTATDEDGNPLEYKSTDWSPNAQHQAYREVVEFITSNADDCREFAGKAGGWTQVGIDFSFTRNRHGAGFWDRGAGAVGDRLTEASRPWGEVNVFIDDETGELVFS